MLCSVPISLDHNSGSFLLLLVGHHWPRTSSGHSASPLIIFWLLKVICPFCCSQKSQAHFLCPTLFFGRTDFLLLFCALGKHASHSIPAFLYRGAIHYCICSFVSLLALVYFQHRKCVENIRSQMGLWTRAKKFKLKCRRNVDEKVAVFSAVPRTWSSHWNPNHILRWPYFNALGISQVQCS